MIRQQRNFTIHLDAKKKFEITPQGFLKADAVFTRTGIFEYDEIVDGCHKKIKELRPDEEVSKQESLDSLKLAPVTMTHPYYLVTIDNNFVYQVGMTGENISFDGKFVNGKIIITDKKTIEKILLKHERKESIELSCGYECSLEDSIGIYDNQSYDRIQREIKYNHVAIVDKGRAGPDVKIKMDNKGLNTIIIK